ncbi:MAG: GNAT family N-acetyltransferase [Bacteroidales bacterium]
MEARVLLTQEIEEYGKMSERIGSVFSHLEWSTCFGPEAQICGIFNDNHDLVGGFIFRKTTIMGYPYYTNLPFTPSIALFYLNPAKNSAKRLSTDKEVLDTVARFFRQFRLPVQRYCLPSEIIDMQPFVWNELKVIPHLTYQVDLSFSRDILYSNVSTKLRNNIKKAVSDGITVKQIADYSQCESMIINTFTRQETGINQNHIRNILHRFANEHNSFAFGAYNGDRMIAVSFFLNDQNTVYYMFGGFDDALKHEGAGAATIWEAICLAKSREFKIFDFEGSMIPRIERYFRGFGGEIKNYFTVNRAPFLIEVALKLFKRSIF